MVKRFQILISFIFICVNTFAQVVDNFSDGDFTTNPTWSGTTADFIVNGSQQLQLNNTVAGISYLTTNHNLTSIDNKEWRIWIKYSFAPSSSNYGRIFLTSTISDLTQGNYAGYYLQLGSAGTSDAIELHRSVLGIDTLICTGPLGQIANNFTLSLKVKRNNLGDWSIYGDFTGGENYSLIAIGNDPTAYIGNYFGISAVYTVSNATKFYYDDLYIGNEILDLIPPVLDTVLAISGTQVNIFSEVGKIGRASCRERVSFLV